MDHFQKGVSADRGLPNEVADRILEDLNPRRGVDHPATTDTDERH